MTRIEKASTTLRAEVVAAQGLDSAGVDAMFRLYRDYYAPADRRAFSADLAAKTHVILLFDAGSRLRGFSTIRRWRADTPLGPRAFMYSGDTVIAQAFWGSQTLPLRWIELAGELKAADPATPLHWLLISKGHRTYRLMPAFARRSFPSRSEPTPPAMAALMTYMGAALFGPRFDAAAGVVRREPGGAALKPAFAGLDAARRRHPEIRHFLALNPGHGEGDELLCLCDLSMENLRPMAQTRFARGYARAGLDAASRGGGG